MAKVLERPITEMPTMQESYKRACELFPGYRVELVNGRIVVNDVPTGDHNDIISNLLMQIISVVAANGWKLWTNIKLFLGPQADRYIPDLTIVPRNPRMWGDDEVYGDDTHLVVEVVSPSSGHDDHAIKPREYARAGVPLYLLIDPAQDLAVLFSLPAEKGYQQKTQVDLGKALDLPAPWDLSLDTAKLIES
ncbi:Uma2 family endonuclease [Nonomuraea africana]|uniref:Uma2 family endonuclease n=1 Tax=Nonomuraea africana TaxID=46171 RepID=A0ABR9KLR7_9ACTN|nr:Uma2 family endonuclease [Nonomuraea africana]MBE1562968.1 Uma2 family endonuclease [Nonomuraea africana]